MLSRLDDNSESALFADLNGRVFQQNPPELVIPTIQCLGQDYGLAAVSIALAP
jgi:hypothetical protein